MTGEHQDDEHHERIVRIPIDDQRHSMTSPSNAILEGSLTIPKFAEGVYNSAVFVAQDIRLRRSIKSSALLRSSKLLYSIGTTQITKEIEDKVMKMTEDDTYAFTQWSGVAPSD
jgi:hypothetical protein